MTRFQVRKVAVLGAGVMGAQIAAHLVNCKVPVVLFDLAAKEGAIQSKVTKLEADKSERGGGRDSIVKRLPSILYRRYEQLRGKRGIAITQTSDGTCKMCNMSLPPQLYHRLRREPLIEQCQMCNRIIYYSAPASVTEATKVD